MEKSKIDRIREIRKGKSNAKPSVSEEIRKYFMSNLLSVIWSASLLGGGLIFWFYFFQIQYFPDLTFDESVLSLILAAITGIFFLWLMATLLMTPYFFRWIVLKAYDYDLGLNGKDRQKSGLGELIWYFFSMFLGTLTLFLIVLKGVSTSLS